MTQLANRPAFLGQSSNVIDALAGGLSASMPPRIKTKNGFEPIDENGVATMPGQMELDVVIVGANPHKSRIYYPDDSDPDGGGTPPSCFSDNGVAPSEKAIDPQHATCAGCPRAVWGKLNAKGNNVPWCQSRKKAAVLVIGGGETVYLLDVPPASHKQGLQPYIDSLRHQGADVSDVITHVTKKDNILHFEAKGWLPNEKTYNFVQNVMKGDLPANVVNLYDKPRQGALPAPTVTNTPRAPEPQIERQIAETVAEKFITPQMEIPTVRHGPLLPEFHPEMTQPVVQPKAGPSAETQAKLDSLFAKFGPK